MGMRTDGAVDSCGPPSAASFSYLYASSVVGIRSLRTPRAADVEGEL